MLLGFKKQFAAYVEEGSKTHTIRAAAKRIPKIGEGCHCYTDSRRKTMRLLGRWICTRVETVSITRVLNPKAPLWLAIEGALLSPDETNAFFLRDGFRDENGETFSYIWQAAEFWERTHRLIEGTTFYGYVIHWDYSQRAATPGRRKRTKAESKLPVKPSR